MKKKKFFYPTAIIAISNVMTIHNLFLLNKEWAFFWVSLSWFMVGISFIIKAIEDK